MGTAAQEVVREVGISHCNNSKSLIDHVHAFDTTHYVLDTLQKELLSFLWDLGYYLTKKERDEICQVLDDVQYACHDMHFNETVNNYHRHHFDINKQTEAKGLRSWATDGIGITHMYKQLVMESKRQETKQTEEYINHLVHNFIHELTLHAQKLKDVFDKCRSRVNAYNPMCTPLMSVEFEDYEAKKEIKERRGDPTWLKTHGDRPHHTLGLPRPQKPLPTGDQTSFQGGRNLYESYINERKSALNQPKYTYKIQGLQDQTEAKVRAEAARRLELPQRR
ncbi:uncharacterized protein LOC142352911 [Convolutriloba macropyga]|uniref:uncharacterized protein LOC142352911 n=1 Tax=Convolutriloba macropyga TaxID=536237 RepID=UPI003F51C540